MSSMKAVTLLACAAPVAGVSVARTGFLARATRTGMQPAVVADTLVNVEDEWATQAIAFFDCNSTSGELEACGASTKAFQKSCNTVVSAVVEGSAGDRSIAGEYMSDVCSQQSLSGWRSARCQSLSEAIAGAMTADVFENREHLDTTKLCAGFWQRVLSEESGRVKKARAKAAAEEDSRRKAEAAEAADQAKRLAEEKAEAAEAAKK